MASKALRGLTIEIGGDTTELNKALDKVDKRSRDLSSELGQINKALKLDPTNTELLAQKQKVLADAISTTEDKLGTLKDAEKQVQKQFERGEVSQEQVRALRREIIETERKLNGYKNAVKGANKEVDDHGKQAREASDDVEKLADASKEADKASGGLGSALGSAAKAGLAAVGAAVGAVVSGLTAAAEGSREYRAEMGKLDTAFSANEHSAETATKTYETLQGIIGETDQSVEAAQQIALLADSEEDAAKWANLAAGVVGRFGDALQPETFFEAANETLKLGEATGGYTQMLEQAGYDVEKFNKGLAKCKTEGEKQAYMLKVTDELLGDAADKYRETNEEIIRANQANEEWMQSLSGVGGAVEPILTDIKMMGASLLSDLVPGVQELATAFRGVLSGDEGAAEDLGASLSGIITSLATKVTELAPTIIKVAVSLINTLVTTLISMLPQLVTTGIELIGSIISGLTTAIPVITQAIADMIPLLVKAFVDGIPMLIDGAVKLLLAVCEAIPVLLNALIPQIPSIVMSIVNGLLDNLDELLNGAITLLMAIVQAVPVLIKTLLPMLPTIVKKVVQTLIANLPVLLDGAVQLFMALVKAIPEIIVELNRSIPDIITAIVDGLVDGIGDISDVGGELIRGLWNGIKDMTGWITGKLSSFGDTVLGGIKDFFGIKSPSRVMAKEVGRFLPAGLAKGISDNADVALDAMTSLSDDMLTEAERVNGVTLERRLHTTFDPVPQSEVMASGLLGKLDSILTAIEKGQVITLDGDALVGATANMMDSALGRRRALASRGAI